MNYTVYEALNTLANGTTNFNSTVGAVGAAIEAIDANFNGTDTQLTLTWIMGGHDGWTNNLTTLGGNAWATAYPNITNSTSISFSQTDWWKYIDGDITVAPIS